MGGAEGLFCAFGDHRLWYLKKTRMFAGDPAPFVMELPAYHLPTVRTLRSMWGESWSFIKKAGGHSVRAPACFLFRVGGIRYSAQPYTEGKSKPDFIFPSIECYRDEGFPSSSLTMLGAKTTIRSAGGRCSRRRTASSVSTLSRWSPP